MLCFLPLVSRKVLHMLTTAEGIMTQTDRLNGDGLQEVFTTNLFGHFILVRLCKSWAVGLGSTAQWVLMWVLPFRF